ncbi:C2H2-like zinc finger protein [Hibiscus syriacus]|uniref:C2H2-like zinc finger protein n=1 Tax=Hibiscus syriacus TaxID=106335 RepID=A0A6A3D9X8_HIBSY|nr:C2H2-like zinc finger protein [Hibiscus syriacus]
MLALSTKNKLGFIDGSIVTPNSSMVDQFHAWTWANNLVISWILNSVSKDIAASLLYHTTAEMWKDLVDCFQQSNGPRLFQLKKLLCELVQDQVSIRYSFKNGSFDVRGKGSQVAHTNSIISHQESSGSTVGEAFTPQQWISPVCAIDSKDCGFSKCVVDHSSVLEPQHGQNVLLPIQHNHHEIAMEYHVNDDTAWRNAMNDELRAMESLDTWSIVSLPEGKSAIDWFCLLLQQLEDVIYCNCTNMVCKLRKSIYGLKQASRQWFYVFSSVVLKLGFQQSHVEHSLFTKGFNDTFVALLVYVDDIVIADADLQLLYETQNLLKQYFKLKELVPLHYFLGFEVAHNASGISISQRKNALQFLEDT